MGRQINDGRKLICVLLFSPAGKNSATQIGLWFCCLFVCRIFLLGGCLFTGFSQLFFGRLSLSNGSVAAMKLTATRQRRGLDMDLCFSWVLLPFRVRGWCLSGGVENAFPPFFFISWMTFSKGGQRSRGPLSAVFAPFGFRSARWGVLFLFVAFWFV